MNKKLVLLSLILMVSLNVGCNSGNTNESTSGDISRSTKSKDDESNWNTYNNERFEFSIKYPENFGYTESENGDGATFLTGDEDVNMSAYASNAMDEFSEPFSPANEYNLKEEQVKLSSGTEATVLKGSVDSDYHYEVAYVSDDIEYHFLSITSVDYYIDNKDMIEEMGNSFNPPKNNNKDSANDYEVNKEENMINEENNSHSLNNSRKENNDSNKDKFTESEALAIYKDFSNRIYITYDTDSDRVSNYNTKAELVDHISEIADKSLAKGYVDYYYSERDGGLYMDAQEKTEEIDFNIPYEFNQINDSNYELVQEADNDFDEPGRYRLTVSFSYKNNRWIISDENVDQI